MIRKPLLACGPLYGLTYVIANDVIAAAIHDGYSRRDQAISELSAVGAPAAAFLQAMAPIFSLLVIAFGIGVWKAAEQNRWLRVTGGILIAQALSWPLWLLFPMSSRAELAAGRGGINDTGHLGLTALAIVLILSQMGFSAAALGRRFAAFSVAMAVACVISGGVVGLLSSGIVAGQATPWLGLIERITYGSWLAWMAGLGIILLRREFPRLQPALATPPLAANR